MKCALLCAIANLFSGCGVAQHKVDYLFEKVTVNGIPEEVEHIVVYSTPSHISSREDRERYGSRDYVRPEFFRVEGKAGVIDNPEIKMLLKPVKKYPIENITFSGFELSDTHLGSEDEQVIHYLLISQTIPGHDYSNIASKTVYVFSRVK